MAFPVAPIVPMTAAEYAAMPEDEDIHYELQEGVLVPMASPTPENQISIRRLMRQIEDQMPAHLDVLSDVDIDLQITPAHRPGFVRRPDVAVVTRAGIARRKAEGGILRADELVLAIEIVSIGSQRTDGVIKHGEYADARIAHYWTVELDDWPTLVSRHLAGEFGYASDPAVRGVFTTDTPFPVTIDLDALG